MKQTSSAKNLPESSSKKSKLDPKAASQVPSESPEEKKFRYLRARIAESALALPDRIKFTISSAVTNSLSDPLSPILMVLSSEENALETTVAYRPPSLERGVEVLNALFVLGHNESFFKKRSHHKYPEASVAVNNAFVSHLCRGDDESEEGDVEVLERYLGFSSAGDLGTLTEIHGTTLETSGRDRNRWNLNPFLFTMYLDGWC
jgi:hypothetical protein